MVPLGQGRARAPEEPRDVHCRISGAQCDQPHRAPSQKWGHAEVEGVSPSRRSGLTPTLLSTSLNLYHWTCCSLRYHPASSAFISHCREANGTDWGEDGVERAKQERGCGGLDRQGDGLGCAA